MIRRQIHSSGRKPADRTPERRAHLASIGGARFLPTELREKAARWRAEADRAHDTREKQRFLELADAYEKLAEQLAARPSTATPASASPLRILERGGKDV